MKTWDMTTMLPELPLSIYCLSEGRVHTSVTNAIYAVLNQVVAVFKAQSNGEGDIYSVFIAVIDASDAMQGRWPQDVSLPGLGESYLFHRYQPPESCIGLNSF